MRENEGTLFVIAAPSGAGKTSLVKAVTETTQSICVSVSHTTRVRRPGEEDGLHYHFITQDEFEKMITEKAFLEYAQVFDHYYGTSRARVENALKRGTDVVLEIDWQGARAIKTLVPECISIFILPPSMTSLRYRLERREQDSAEVIEKRMALAKKEISHYTEFDYIVLNDDFSHAVNDLKTIILAQRFALKKQAWRYAPLIQELLS